MSGPQCPGCHQSQPYAPPSIDGDWWCFRCLNGKVAACILAAADDPTTSLGSP